MRGIFIGLLASALVATGAAAAPPVVPIRDTSFKDAGFARWAVPVAKITPGNGGMMESGLFPAGKIGDADNVRNRVDVGLPDQLLAIHNEHVPSGGPLDPQTRGMVRQMIAFEPAGANGAKVTQTVIGFGDGA